MVRGLTEVTDYERAQAMAQFQVLRPFLEEDAALTDLARQHAYPLPTLRRWVQRCRTAGLAGLVRTLYAPPSERPAKPESMVEHAVKTYAQKRAETPEPTTLLLIDETDRLKTAGLEQVRDIFDQGGLGVVLIGMPG